MGCTDGRSSHPRSDSICVWNLCRCAGDGCGGICLWHRRRCGVASFSAAGADDGPHRRVWDNPQGISVWKLRRSIQLARLLPFLVGGAFGVPIGVELLHRISPAALRLAVGVVLILFSLYSLVRPQLASVRAGKAADGTIGILNGIVGGATGLAGIVVTIWCTLRGWPRDEQRTTFQAVGVGIFLMTGLWLGGIGLVGADILRLFIIGLPLLLAGTWVGLRLYARLDEAGFRKVVLGLLLISGLALVMRGS